MDLNASPLPEDDEQPYAEHIENVLAQEERNESALATYMRVICYFFLFESSVTFCIRMRMFQFLACWSTSVEFLIMNFYDMEKNIQGNFVCKYVEFIITILQSALCEY
jgi:hypothetical protein